VWPRQRPFDMQSANRAATFLLVIDVPLSE
jgi:hypothetical protein